MKRTKSHEISSVSGAFVEKFFSKWVVNPLYNDYALDYKVDIVEDNNVSNIEFYIQLKGTDAIKVINNTTVFDIKTRYLKYFEQKFIPVLLILYATKSNIGYWLNIQKYVRETLDVEKPKWRDQSYVRVKFPDKNILDDLSTIRDEIINFFYENISNLSKNLPKYSKEKTILEAKKQIARIFVMGKSYYIPVFVYIKDFQLDKPILFLIDTGANITTISTGDLPEQYSKIIGSRKMISSKVAGIGGVQTVYSIKNANLYFLTENSVWFLGKKLSQLDILPCPKNGDHTIYIPSLLGQDVLGDKCALHIEKDKTYLEFDLS